MYSTSPKSKRIEFRPPDPLANPYLAFPAMLMAGLDGIARGLKPSDGVFRDDLIQTYVEFHREQSDKVKIRPHPFEFPLYFDG
jgi:glutamine synthetase